MAPPAGNDAALIGDLSDWKALACSGGAGTIAPELLAVPLQPTVADLAALRARWPRGVVAVAVENARARHRARGKLPGDLVDNLLADEPGVMVASSALASAHKAARFAAAGARQVLDLCCGIGADAHALTRAGLMVTAVDHDPVRAWMASSNAACGALVRDVGSTESLERIAGQPVHLDPSRRDADTRRHDYDLYQPGPQTIAAIVAAASGACVKLGPGVDFSRLPTPEPSFLELLSERGRLTQALLWTGTLATIDPPPPGYRRATLLPDGHRFDALPGPLITPEDWDEGDGHERPVQTYLYEADPALERAHLLGAFARLNGLRPVHPAVGVLTGESIVESPWLTRFDVLDTMPWGRKPVKARLRELGAGVVTVKTRGQAVDPDPLQKALRGSGTRPITLFVLRLGDQARAILTLPAQHAPRPSP